jgi:hypothetical protein
MLAESIGQVLDDECRLSYHNRRTRFSINCDKRTFPEWMDFAELFGCEWQVLAGYLQSALVHFELVRNIAFFQKP